MIIELDTERFAEHLRWQSDQYNIYSKEADRASRDFASIPCLVFNP